MKKKSLKLVIDFFSNKKHERNKILTKLSKEYGLEPEGIDLIEKAFDSNYYLTKYADVRKSSYSPFIHFLKYGITEQRNPNADFNMEYYITNNPDVIDSNMHPFHHYLLTGKHEKRAPLRTLSLVDEFKRRTCPIYKAIEQDFDIDFYLSSYEDIKKLEIDPISHYIEFGAAEHRDPNRFFSTKYYLEDNEDVVKANINPFYHYVVAGQFERRFPKIPGGAKAKLIWEQKPIKEVANLWKINIVPSEIETVDLSHITKNISRLVVSFSHDNFVENTGGVQLCVGLEQQVFEQNDHCYLHLSPFNPSPLLASVEDVESCYYNVVVNQKPIGIAVQSDLVSIFQSYKGESQFILHALQGHSPFHIKELIESCQNVKALKIWVHDSFIMCPSYTARRNNIDFCHLPSVDSQACNICMYGLERKTHIERIHSLFGLNLPTTVICPSEYTANLFRNKNPYPKVGVVVQPHLSLRDKSKKESAASDLPIRVAFVGFPVHHKGWDDFVELYYSLEANTRYKFIHIGSTQSTITGLEFIETTVCSSNSLAMIETIKDNNIDVVFIPSRIPETFNFVAHEAIAAGAQVFCYQDSGNISKAVDTYQQGTVLQSVQDVIDELENNFEAIQNKERHYYNVAFNNFSFGL